MLPRATRRASRVQIDCTTLHVPGMATVDVRATSRMKGALLEARTPGADDTGLEPEIEHALEKFHDGGACIGVQLVETTDVSGDADAVLGAQAASKVTTPDEGVRVEG